LKISGTPNFAIASSNASTQNDGSSVFDNLQESVLRDAQSMIATRYANPFGIGMYVMSVAHTWLARVIDRDRSRYG